MLACFAAERITADHTAIIPLTEADLGYWCSDQNPALARWVERTRFSAKSGEVLALNVDDRLTYLAGLGNGMDILAFGAVPGKLPEGRYFLGEQVPAHLRPSLIMAWGMGSYVFDRYKSQRKPGPVLLLERGEAELAQMAVLEGLSLTRDLVNMPAGDLGPSELAQAVSDIADRFGARCTVVRGQELLAANYPSVHAVGRASSRPPAMIEMSWGKSGPLIALVGKGVCFDSGGLDLKPASGMQLMKKDMGGAALLLGLAQAIMRRKLAVRLLLLIPAVENAVSGNAYRPLDVIKTRAGTTVEIGNTDAEGRVILCDALTRAVEAEPALIVDAATLTGAARIALGTDLPALFSNDDDMAQHLLAHGLREQDPLWRMPLHRPYRAMMDGKVADMTNASDSPYAGAITAALYLQEFVPARIPWLHIDTMAWNLTGKPGRPQGGEGQAMRALFAFVNELAQPRAIKTKKPAPRKNPPRRR
ncbi:MAG TPA: leucyl aminopeptidase family protein [Dongiaceae bacterium]|jgi:leucyl aminopeptidase|nr:leucyl aminopeptidase family protein [Dongiaceae bacterium]